MFSPDHDRKGEAPCKAYDRPAKLEAEVRRMDGENRQTGFVSPGKSVAIIQQKLSDMQSGKFTYLREALNYY